jgi:hypothetical protein
MRADGHAQAVHGRRKVLWLFVFAVVVLHAGLGSLGLHAGVLRATCAGSPAAPAVPQGARPANVGGGLAEGAEVGVEPPGGGAATSAAGASAAALSGPPCAPVPHPHHPPCRGLGDRGPGHQRTTVPWQAAGGPRCPLPMDHGRRLAGPGLACPRGRSSQAPAPRSGAGLLIDLCASRT